MREDDVGSTIVIEGLGWEGCGVMFEDKKVMSELGGASSD